MKIILTEIDRLILESLEATDHRSIPTYLIDIARQSGKPKQTIYHHGRKLEKYGLIGKRTVGAWITPFGLRILRQCREKEWENGTIKVDGEISVRIVSRDSFYITGIHKTSNS